MQRWLFKSEESVYSIDDLKAAPASTDGWEGVRNYQVRNYLRDEIKKGDLVFFYHSNCPVPGIAGTAKVVREGYPDPFAFNRKSTYYDPKSSPEKPVWYTVDVRFVKKFPSVVPLSALRENPALTGMKVLHRACRLSITPVTEREWDIVMSMVKK